LIYHLVEFQQAVSAPEVLKATYTSARKEAGADLHTTAAERAHASKLSKKVLLETYFCTFSLIVVALQHSWSWRVNSAPHQQLCFVRVPYAEISVSTQQMFRKRLCVACVLLFALAGHATADPAASTEGSVGASIMHKVDRETMPDLLEQTGIPESMKGYWTMVGQYMWDQLLTLDHDFFDAQGHVVPPGSPDLAYVASGSKVKCGRFARAWVS
jgi:hypothetical protein